MSATRERAQREAAFHDHAFEQGDRQAAERFYSITERSSRRYEGLLRTIPSSASVLEYGCGQGSAAFHLLERGVHVTGVDISPVGVRQAREAAQLRGLSTAQFTVMDAENLDFGPRLLTTFAVPGSSTIWIWRRRSRRFPESCAMTERPSSWNPWDTTP